MEWCMQSWQKKLRERAAKNYPEGSLQKYIESATYVNLRDCKLFQ